jgi:two-component system copper resistance phosphate regulon response regulator CusR
MMKGVRVLVVEDQKNVARFVAKGLREQSYAVDVAEDGERAIYQTEVEEYDVIVLDVMLPKADGFEVCRRLRERGVATPILMLTARDDKASRLRGLDTGADDYLTKPFDFDELLARLRALLRRGREYRRPRVAVADLELDTNRHEASRAGRVIALTAKEYALLEYLLRNPGRVVSREEISRHVWDETFDPFSNVIEVYIGRLRKKIDGGEPVKLLHTRRGAGYVVEPRSGAAAED